MNKFTPDMRRDVEPVGTTNSDDADQNRFWASPQFVRFIIVPLAVSLLLAGGVLWIHTQVPSGADLDGDSATVQVQLLRRPDATPIRAQVALQTVNSAIATEKTTSHHDTEAVSTSEIPDSVDIPKPAADPNAAFALDEPPAPLNLQPTNAILNFQQAVLRQVRRYQHYPDTARQEGLQGTVET
jgi:periplasmic protein TonB